jgi:hypothetical protein
MLRIIRRLSLSVLYSNFKAVEHGYHNSGLKLIATIFVPQANIGRAGHCPDHPGGCSCGFNLRVADKFYTPINDKAFEWLEMAFQERLVELKYILTNAYLKSLQNDPRYPTFLDKLGLLEACQQYGRA